MFLLDDTSNRGSDSGYKPGDNSLGTYQPTDSENNNQSYPSMNQGQNVGSDFDDSGYESQNKENFNNPEYQSEKPQQEKARLIDEAKRFIKRGRALSERTVPKKIGDALGDRHIFKDDSPENRDRAKELASKKAREVAQDQIGKRLGNEALQRGFEKGISKGTKDLVKEGAGKAVGRSAGKAVGKGVAEAGAEVGAKAAAQVGAKAAVAGLEGAVDIAGGATGFETFGLGFLLAFLINIAISLGVSDAVDAAFELKNGNLRESYFLIVRAGSKIGVFLWFLIAILPMFTIAGIFISIPMLFLLNIYMILGLLPPFKRFPRLQGMVWWERVILIAIDLIAFLILSAFIGGLVYYLCSTSGLGSGGVTGTVTGAVASVYDWWTGGSAGAFAKDLCSTVNAPAH